MKIVINQLNGRYLDTISLENLDNINESLKKFSSMNEPLEAKIFAINESICAQQLSNLKNKMPKPSSIQFILFLFNTRMTLGKGPNFSVMSNEFKPISFSMYGSAPASNSNVTISTSPLLAA